MPQLSMWRMNQRKAAAGANAQASALYNNAVERALHRRWLEKITQNLQ